MSEIPTEAVEAAREAFCKAAFGPDESDTKPTVALEVHAAMRPAVEAAAPLIAAATAEAIATAIEAQKAFTAGITRLHALNDAARIARGFAAGGQS